MQEPNTVSDFNDFVNELFLDIETLKGEIYKTIVGNKAAAVRARKATVAMNNKFKLFRKLSLKFITKAK